MNIKSERIKLGLEQKELAEELKTSPSSISRWERGVTRPDADQLVAMSELFGCTIDYILGKTEERLAH